MVLVWSGYIDFWFFRRIFGSTPARAVGDLLVQRVICWTAALAVFVMAPMACFLAGLTGYVWRDLAGKWGPRLTLDADSVTLDLPRGRSLIHRPSAEHLTILYEDIEAIETRLEAYRTLGMAMMQRAFVLRRKNGETIFLFEDRALATPLSLPIFAQMAADLAKRAAVPLRDIGMVEGRGGVLGVWGRMQRIGRLRPCRWRASSGSGGTPRSLAP